MPDGEKKHRNRKSVQLHLAHHQDSSELDLDPVPLNARSSALSFAGTSRRPEEARAPPNHFLSPFTRHPRQMAMAAMSIISPRSGNYDRLEGGMGPSRMGAAAQATGWRRFGWKKLAAGAAAFLFVLWLWGRGSSTEVESGVAKPPPPPVIPPIVEEEEGTSKVPLTFETDPDRRKTLSCTTAHDPTSHLVQYALMIDAGSTGSRIHIYKFNNCKSTPTYEYEVFKMTQPGLSAYANRPLDAARSLDVLLEAAARVVPKEMWSCTPVAVKATAGLRLLGPKQSTDILAQVERRIRARYAFQLPARNGVAIMDGKDEGVYAWITANYLLETLSVNTSTTYAVLDLGGASTQIVFEPTFPALVANANASTPKLEPGEHKYDLAFGGRTYELYQHSYLGYGLMRARSHVHRLVEFMSSLRPIPSSEKYHAIDSDGDGRPDLNTIPNPCLAQGTHRIVEIMDEPSATTARPATAQRPPATPPAPAIRRVAMAGADVGGFAACDRVVQLVLAKDAVCQVKPCAFNGVYQPSLLDSFQNGKVLLLSYFYDRLAPLLEPSLSTEVGSGTLSVDNFAKAAQTVCAGPQAWATIPHWASNAALLADLKGRPEWCLDLTFMHALLRMGYEFEEEQRVDIGKKIANTELGWCLGATIAMVGGGQLKCKA